MVSKIELLDKHRSRVRLSSGAGRRPNSAPAYYLGQPALLWITVMRRDGGDSSPAIR